MQLNSMNDLEIMGDGIKTLSSMNEVEIMGERIAGVLDDLGAPQASHVRQAVHHARQMHASGAHAAAIAHAVQVMDVAFKSVSWLPLGVPETLFTVAGSTIGPILVTTSRPLKPRDFEIPSSIAQFFSIVSATIAGVDMVLGNTIPGESYSTANLRSKVQWITINTSTPLNLIVKNTETVLPAGGRTFRASLAGPALMR